MKMKVHKTRCEILALPLSNREKYHRSRKRMGFHVYLSWLSLDFYSLSEGNKLEELVETVGLNECIHVDMGDDMSIDSTNSPMKIQHT